MWKYKEGPGWKQPICSHVLYVISGCHYEPRVPHITWLREGLQNKCQHQAKQYQRKRQHIADAALSSPKWQIFPAKPFSLDFLRREDIICFNFHARFSCRSFPISLNWIEIVVVSCIHVCRHSHGVDIPASFDRDECATESFQQEFA